MKYCKDCRFYREAGAVSFFGYGVIWPESCISPGPQPWPRSLISGEIVQGWRNPLEQRNDESTCGMDGKWFQPIPEKPSIEIEDTPPSDFSDALKYQLAVSVSEDYKGPYTLWSKIKAMFRHE